MAVFCYTIQLITIKLCTKFQNPEVVAEKSLTGKGLQTDKQTEKQTNKVPEKAKLYTPYILCTGGLKYYIKS